MIRFVVISTIDFCILMHIILTTNPISTKLFYSVRYYHSFQNVVDLTVQFHNDLSSVVKNGMH
jgi:hypothetical protein